MNERGSITIFALLVTMAMIFAFSMYISDLTVGLIENNSERVIENASRNIQSSYDRGFFEDYGLLAYEETVLSAEYDASVSASLKSLKGTGLLPYSPIKKYTTKYEKKTDIVDLESTRDQMVSQALVFVPKEVIENSKLVKDLFEKAKAAKAKIKNIEKITEKLDKLSSLNEKLGRALDKVKKVDEWFKASVSTGGTLKISDSYLKKQRDEIKDRLLKSLEEMTELALDVEKEKKDIQENANEYPDEFAQNMIDQLDGMMTDDDSILSGGFSVEGKTPSTKYRSSVEQMIKAKVKDDTVVQHIMDKYGDGLAVLNETLDDMSEWEEELKDEYESDLKKIKRYAGDRKTRSKAYALKRELLRDLRDDIDDMVEDISVHVVVEKRKNNPDTSTKSYVDQVRGNKLLDSNQEAQDSDTRTLSQAKIDWATFKDLPSNKFKNKSLPLSLHKRFPLSEYIMGTFRHRLTGLEEEPWDFYNKTTRNTYFKDGEIEYIICGKDEEKKNRSRVVTEIFILREAVNLVHVYTCPSKTALASEFSTAVAWPLWTKPIIYNGMLIGWASVESAVDVNHLLKGEKTPVIKLTDADWYTTIKSTKGKAITTKKTSSVTSQNTGGAAKTNTGTSTNKKKKRTSWDFDYNVNEQGYAFYLRFLLNFGPQSQEEMVLRSLDIISINQSMENGSLGTLPDLETYWTGHKLELNWKSGGVTYEAGY